MPEIVYPDLPVSAARAELMAAMRDHQVVVVAGETGSGKTTQLPKMLLELGRGVDGLIGHTQPRRIAARAVAERLAAELGVPLGGVVGYQVRFTDQTAPSTLIKVMTDGILLNEMQKDRDLRRYDTVIIDEAHERSLNIDFILGYLKALLPRRPDLKVVVTSATIDPHAFARHFADVTGVPAPVVEVSGRTYPVEVRYRPLERLDRQGNVVAVDQVTGITDAVEELWTESPGAGPRDILVFLSGEQEIRDAADALNGLNLPATEILPLYARLSSAEQHRVFGPTPPGISRRVVLATNVAETSLTVPGIRYVVDAGTARISRYSQRLKVQRLPIEPISQASARQRSGRCGRLADGVAIRLYSEEDHDSRPEFTEPEILRTNLASVILQMTSLGLGDLSRFPFLDPPDSRRIADGVKLLEELGAFRPPSPGRRGKRLTDLGRRIAGIPADPRLARMLLEADKQGCLRQMLVIVAALSIQDPRERPLEARTQADQMHARFRDDTSDFVTWLRLWDYLRAQQKDLSSSAFRRLCKAEYLHYLRVREWADLHAQLRGVVRSMGLALNDSEPSGEQIHTALLSGLLSHVGRYDERTRDFLGARGAHFSVQPGSALFRRTPEMVMAAELVETTRLWARTVAAVDPAAVEVMAQHVVKRTYAEPHWSRDRASAVAKERVTLYGIPLVHDRLVGMGSIDPRLARELFIRRALVEGDWDTRHQFFHDNLAMVERIEALEERTRRRDLLVADVALITFYDQRIPEHVVSGAHFDSWWKRERQRNPQLLSFTEDMLTTEALAEVDAGAFPTTWQAGDHELRLTYQFQPGDDADGVTVHIPIEVLNQVPETGFDWQVPGLREELAVALVRGLPKATRRLFVPAPDTVRRALPHLPAMSDGDPFADALGRALYVATGHRVPSGEWAPDGVPDHLRMTFRVTGPKGAVLGEGTSLAALQERLAPAVRTTMAAVGRAVERTGLTSWPVVPGEAGAAGWRLPDEFTSEASGRRVVGYPGLVDHGESVAVEVLGSRSARDHATRRGVRRLLLLNTTVSWSRILSLLSTSQKLTLGSAPVGTMDDLLKDVLAAAVDAVVVESGLDVRDAASYQEVARRVQSQVLGKVVEVVEALVPILEEARRIRLSLDGMTSPALAELRADLEQQLAMLVRPGFVADVGAEHLRHLLRWLRGMSERIAKAPEDIRRDSARLADVRVVTKELDKLRAALPSDRLLDPDVQALGRMLQEYRVSLFAQRLGTAYPVSPKRIYAAMDKVEDAS